MSEQQTRKRQLKNKFNLYKEYDTYYKMEPLIEDFEEIRDGQLKDAQSVQDM